MAKYDRLGEHLSELSRDTSHTLAFERIEAILGFALPRSARSYQAWWANQVGGGHVQANAWLDEGWHTEQLSLGRRQVTFTPVTTPRAPKGVRGSAQPGLSIDEAKRAVALRYRVRPDEVEIVVHA
jgi:hypothetical protein